MSVLKDFRFQVDVDHPTGKTVRLTAPGKPELEIATPPEFRGGVPNVWSPEDLLVAAVASCYALTLAAVFERRAVPLHELAVAGAGHMTKRADGGFGFVVVELGVTLTTDEGRENEAQKAARAPSLPVWVQTRWPSQSRSSGSSGPSRPACPPTLSSKVVA
jgi:organic hydroperoxide reductase OsmC/OhrA